MPGPMRSAARTESVIGFRELYVIATRIYNQRYIIVYRPDRLCINGRHLTYSALAN